ncbi:MAG: hypothetical protein HYY06_16155 [Deltaproteobacteria bacterium]|nr:hypothetical protein [Deltaproteobacteria bacterium]
MRGVALAVVAALVGCIGTDDGTVAIPVLDPLVFREDVQPILATRCGNPTCHGRADRPFSIYSAGAYRADPARTFLDEPLTPEELAQNYIGACGFALELESTSPSSCELLQKPLAIDAGGMGHLGGDVWIDERDREYRTVEAWVRAPLDPPEEARQ